MKVTQYWYKLKDTVAHEKLLVEHLIVSKAKAVYSEVKLDLTGLEDKVEEIVKEVETKIKDAVVDKAKSQVSKKEVTNIGAPKQE